jgi:serine/threonine protein phosphatase 1
MVWKRLFGIKTEIEPRAWSAPDGERIYAIGDIHGRLDLLNILLDKIDADDAMRPAAKTILIFLGDLVDRGPDSKGVVERLMMLKAANSDIGLISGNHEELLIRTWKGDKRSAGLFNRVGGKETLLSYGVDQAAYDAADLADLTELAAKHVPADHIEFLKSFDTHIEAGDYLFVHAGIRPGYAIEEQEASDLRWIRREFTEHEGDFGRMVVHGHTIVEEVDERPNRVGIDTGAFATGRLTAIGIEGSERWFLQTGS